MFVADTSVIMAGNGLPCQKKTKQGGVEDMEFRGLLKKENVEIPGVT